jgi:hypothetical protein
MSGHLLRTNDFSVVELYNTIYLSRGLFTIYVYTHPDGRRMSSFSDIGIVLTKSCLQNLGRLFPNIRCGE